MAEKRQLSSLCELKKGKKVNAFKEKTSNSIPYLLIDTLRGLPATDFTSDKKYTEAIPEDILIVGDGANSGLVGTGLTGAVGSTIIRIRLTEKTARKDYIMYYLRSKFFQLNTNVKGAAIPHLKTKEMLDLEIRFPEPKEQELIVAEIEKQFTRLDSAIESLQTIKKKLEVYRKSVLKKLFINNNWNWKTLGEISKVVVSYVGPISKYYTTNGTGLPLLSTKNISFKGLKLEKVKHITKEFHIKNLKSQIYPGDILVARHGASGQACVITEEIKEGHALNVILIKKSPVLNSQFLVYLLNSKILDEIEKNKSGSVQRIVNTTVLKNLSLPVPSLKMQEDIVLKTDEQFSVIEQLELTINASLLKAETLRKSILKSAFEGKLVEVKNA